MARVSISLNKILSHDYGGSKKAKIKFVLYTAIILELMHGRLGVKKGQIGSDLRCD